MVECVNLLIYIVYYINNKTYKNIKKEKYRDCTPKNPIDQIFYSNQKIIKVFFFLLF